MPVLYSGKSFGYGLSVYVYRSSRPKEIPLTKRFKRNPDYFEDPTLTTTKSTIPAGTRAVQIYYEGDQSKPIPPEDDPRFVKVEVPAGSCVLIHGSVC